MRLMWHDCYVMICVIASVQLRAAEHPWVRAYGHSDVIGGGRYVRVLR